MSRYPGDGRGEAALWQSTVLQIILDATAEPSPTQVEALRAKADALRWINGPATQWKRMVLSLAGVEVDSFFARAREATNSSKGLTES